MKQEEKIKELEKRIDDLESGLLEQAKHMQLMAERIVRNLI